MTTTTVRTICECGHEGGHQCPLDWSQAPQSVRRFAAIWAAAYRAAADELRVVADEAVMWQVSSAYAAAANLLCARADEMEQS